jgi:tetratricopeptide (TPR) repeat protein
MPTSRQRDSDQHRAFIGREAELTALQSYVGQGRLALLSGEAGIGKTRLVEEFALRVVRPERTVHWGRCWDDVGAPAFWPWIDIVRSLARATAPDVLRAQLGHGAAEIACLVPEVRERLPDLAVAPVVEGKYARFRLFEAVVTFLGNAASGGPLILILEDLHWADAPSLQLLRFLAREIGASSLLVIGTFRDTELRDGSPLGDLLARVARYRDCNRMALAGLSEGEVRCYLDAQGRAVGESLVAALYRDTEGNPFYLGEFVRLLAKDPPSDETGTRPYPIPSTVRDVIRRRLDAYSPNCQEMLRVAAVAGAPFTLALLQRVPAVAHLAVLSLLSDALAGGLVVATSDDAPSYRFAHALIRDTLYDDLSLERRVRLHNVVGETLEQLHGGNEVCVRDLAHHFARGASQDHGERAIHYALRAAEQAGAAGAHHDAAAQYASALELLRQWQPSDERRMCGALVGLGEARVRSGDPAAAEEAFVEAIALARHVGESEIFARATLGLGEVERFHDRLVPLLEEALRLLGSDDGAQRVRLLTRLAVALYWSEREDHKRALSEEAVAMARRLAVPSTLAYALAGRIATLSGPDDVEERLATAVEMRRVADRCGDRELSMIGRGWSIADRLALGDADRVWAEVDAFAAAATDLRHPYFLWWSTAMRVMQAILQGRLADAEGLAQQALHLGQRAIVADAMQVFAGHFYVICIEQERLDQLEAIVVDFVRQFPHLPNGHCGLALLYAERGRFADGEAEMAKIAADDFRALPRNPEWLGSIAALAETSVLLPDAPYAETLYALLRDYRHRIIVSGLGALCSGSVAHFLGVLASRLGHWEDAADHLEEALRVHRRLEAPAWVAYTRCELARLALARGGAGDLERAAGLRADAQRVADELGMARLRRRLRVLETAPPGAALGPARRRGALRKEGEYWTVRWERGEFRLRDSVGLQYLAILIGNPGREFLAIDLIAARRAAAPSTPEHRPRTGDRELHAGHLGDAGSVLDPQARSAYRTRVDELRGELAEALRFNDAARASRAQGELDMLLGELARAVGLGGRERRAGSPVERARVSATRAIHAAVRRIRENDAALARHLARVIKTGTFCSYTPDVRIAVTWEL